MDVVSFFSYKGGVGRSLAVNQVAERLSEFGLSSLVIDFDLEAPGMQYKFEKDLEKIKATQGVKKGLVDYIHTFFVENEKKKLPENFEDYYYILPKEDKRKAQIWLMPAGNLQSEYWDKLADIDWKRDFLLQGERLGSHLLVDLKERVKKTLDPDYILIDSRTGISDITTLTLRLMADKIIVIAVNNPENLDGSETILQTMLAPQNQWNDKPKELFFALSRFPKPGNDNEVAREKSITEVIRRRFVPALVKDDNFTVLHDDRELAWGEKNISRTLDTEHLTLKEDYGNLFKIITRGNPKLTEADRIQINKKQEAENILSKAVSLGIQGRFEDSLITINQVKERFRGERFYSLRGMILMELLKYKDSINDIEKAIKINKNAYLYMLCATALARLADEEKNGEELYQKAFVKYEQAIKIKPDYAEAYFGWGTYLGTFAALRIEYVNYYYKAFEKYQKAIEIKPDFSDAYFNWAIDLGKLAEIENNDEKIYVQAFDKYLKFTELQPEDAKGYFNWGITLAKLADVKKHDEQIYYQIFAKYRRAAELTPNDANVYYNWGNDLGKLANLKGNDEQIYMQAFAKYEKAIEIKPDASTYYNWGTHLGRLAASKQFNEDLYEQAFDKYKKALEIAPDLIEVYNNWGRQLAELAESKQFNENLYQEVFSLYKKAAEIKPNFALTYLNWGNDLGILAEIKDNDIQLYQEAFSKYERAIEIDPTNADVYINWGTQLGKFAAAKDFNEQLYSEAFSKYQNAITNKHDYATAYINWAYDLGQLAQSKGYDNGLYIEAFDKLQRALDIDVNNLRAYGIWGHQLLLLATFKNADANLLKQSVEKLIEAEKIQTGIASYNLACAYALLKDNKQAFYYLDKALEFKNVTLDHIEKDTDMDNIRNLPEFKKIIDKYTPK